MSSWGRLRAAAVARVAVVAAVVVALAGCGSSSGAVDGGDDGRALLVFGAASLADVLADVATAFEAHHDGVDVEVNLAASSTLATAILEGAPAAVFAAANPTTVQQVVDGGEAAGHPVVFARNRLALVVPAGNPGGVRGVADLERSELVVARCATGVPCGDLAGAALDDAGVDPSLDSEEPDVRALLTKVEAGEVDAALVYRTDVLAAGDAVEAMDDPALGGHTTDYPAVALRGAPDPALAQAFVSFLRSSEAEALLDRRGFAVP